MALGGILCAGLFLLLMTALEINALSILSMAICVSLLLFIFFVFAHRINQNTPLGKRLKYQRIAKKNPRAALQVRLDDMRDQLREIGRQVGTIRTDRRQILRFQTENTELIHAAQEHLKTGTSTTQDGKAAFWVKRIRRYTDHNSRLESLDASLEHVQRILERIYTHGEMIYNDVRHAAQLSMIEYDAVQSANAAVRSAQSFTSARTNNRIEFKTVVDDLDQYLVEMQEAMRISSSAMDQVEFDAESVDQILELKPFAELEKTKILNQPSIDMLHLLSPEEREEKLHNRYLDLLD